ncbi:hypothetical protein ISF_02347 [Cordyceps fumosorosea ARSEF 2679]|uniref:Uncharacterized protein n=1 Tax=Cordyceps fumosorosea (strain ARSEF 2679) TaxID=1081104 RepID=A0A168BP97_CORFA|nr:hypothetical protein ISF_02347 [Cordyceps fumosorosea ARSEF 2679]OAA70373.1 hypothetical protein ISF_02347 [Cordyceps fumosorosea ARSEF 2679]
MADVAVTEVEVPAPDAAAAVPRPQSTEMTIRRAEAPSPVERPSQSAPGDERDEPQAETVVQQTPAAAAPSEAGHMPTPVSDEPSVETRPG